eukprot:2993832-Pyramimonas_sp.AAC.1
MRSIRRSRKSRGNSNQHLGFMQSTPSPVSCLNLPSAHFIISMSGRGSGGASSARRWCWAVSGH